jgi:hypothetical protein
MIIPQDGKIQYIYKIAGKIPQQDFEGKLLCQLWPNQTKHDENGCSHNPASVTDKVSDHHPCHGWQ